MSNFPKVTLPANALFSENCTNRIGSNSPKGVKTQALLVFARTALERYFAQIDAVGFKPQVGNEASTHYVYSTLRSLLSRLQTHVVNVDYMINLVHYAKTMPQLRTLAQFEAPLINYYDAMAEKVATHYANKKSFLPEFLIISLLEYWLSEDEKALLLYPFLKEIDFLDLMAQFEINRSYFEYDSTCTISDIHGLAFAIIEELKTKQYKVKKSKK